MTLLKQFFYEYLKINPSEQYYIGMIDRLVIYENIFSIEYMIMIDTIYKKYKKLYSKEKNKKTDDNIILKYKLDDYDNLRKIASNKRTLIHNADYTSKIDLLPLSSVDNTIMLFIEFMTVFYIIKDKTDINNLNTIFINYLSTIDDIIRLLKQGIKKKYVISKLICNQVIKQFENLLKNKAYIIKVSSKFNKTIEYKCYLDQGANYFNKKMKTLITFLKEIYLSKCSNKIGYLHLPNGKNIYKYIVNSSLTSSSYSILNIHKYGIKEVDYIKKKIMKIKDDLGHTNKTFKQFNNYMLNESKYNYKNTKDLLKDFNKMRKLVKKEIIDTQFFKNVDVDYEIRIIPKEFEKGAALASYYPLSFYTYKKKRKGIFYLNMEDINDHKTFNTLVLSLHEASPGHHYQHAYPMHYKIPLYKNYISENICYAEGWGLYAEHLYDYNQSDINYYGYLIFRILRASRLVVDTGINYYGWTYDKAFKYMKENVPITNLEITRELNRYISIPSQAICYYIGRQIFLEGFKEFEKKNKKINNKYSKETLLKKYHHFVLKDGNIPMEILQKRIKDFQLK